MSKGKKGVDGVDKVIDLFPASSHKMIERLLAKAADREAKQAGRNVRSALRSAMGGGGGRRGSGGLARELGKALRQRGDVGGNKASVRQKSPETGGRPFHFAHSVVSKGDAGTSVGGGKEGGGKGPSGVSGGRGKGGKAAAHMRYIEREDAVERGRGRSLDGVAGPEGGKEAAREEAGREREVGLAVDEKVHATSAKAGQAYVENRVKLANGEEIVFSFGTIGETFEERVKFWEALEEAEAHPNARVQHRLIVELPHEASPQARFDMVKAFTKRFEDDGVPYWAALHAPGENNDSRNTHAHIVYSERPARRMVDPGDGDGREKWDFSITSTYRKKSRNVVTFRPYRQEKLRAYHAKDFIRTIRKEFGEAVNVVLVRDDVRDKDGAPVRYDARSYKDMGVDAVPVRSINRIVADKVRDGKVTVLDGEYTRRMIAAELRDAAARRQKDVLDLIALDNVLRATAEAKRPSSQNGRLPKELRVSPLASPTRTALKAAGRKILEARHAALQVDVMEKATTASLNRILAATEPSRVATAAKVRDPAKRAEAPSPEGAAILHAAALEELEEVKAASSKTRRSIGYRVGAAINEWQALVGAQTPEMSPGVKAALRTMERREEAEEREVAGNRASERDAARGVPFPTANMDVGPGRGDGTNRGVAVRQGFERKGSGDTQDRRSQERRNVKSKPSTMEEALKMGMPPSGIPSYFCYSRCENIL